MQPGIPTHQFNCLSRTGELDVVGDKRAMEVAQKKGLLSQEKPPVIITDNLR